MKYSSFNMPQRIIVKRATLNMIFLFSKLVPMKNVDFIAGKYKQQFQYKSFTPSPINRAFRWSEP